MCGIIAGIKKKNVVDGLIHGLEKLEYRGYDSAGLAFFKEGQIRRLRSVGRVSELKKISRNEESLVGIAHTRWATHGVVSESNAHPHISEANNVTVCVIHNGIIENYLELKAILEKKNYIFQSQTDSEVIAHLIHFERQTSTSLTEALHKARKKLVGAYAVVVLCDADPFIICATKKSSSLVLGQNNNNECFLSSDPISLAKLSKSITFLEDEDLICISKENVKIYSENLKQINRKSKEIIIAEENISIGEYSNFMIKEINEQPSAIASTLETIFDENSITSELFGAKASKIFNNTNAIKILACGTSFHAGLVAKYWIEHLCKIPVSVEIASEFRYRKSAVFEKTLIIGISQSGETADTLAAIEVAKEIYSCSVLGICNVQESALTRISDICFLTRAGIEIGVASTKAFTTQLSALFTLSLVLAKVKNCLPSKKERDLLRSLRHLPKAAAAVLKGENQIKDWTEYFKNKQNVLFLGRGIHYPIALEGALKLKEISYIHAEAYAAGELKHGPLALIDENMPIIAVAPNDKLVNKLKNNLEEVKARGGKLFIIADHGLELVEDSCTKIVTLGDHAGYLSPILHTIPLQLLAYHVAISRGNDVDKPRNLAKSVTVE